MQEEGGLVTMQLKEMTVNSTGLSAILPTMSHLEIGKVAEGSQGIVIIIAMSGE